LLYPYFKEDVILIILLPVIAAGWYQGFLKGVITLAVYYSVNLFLLMKFKNYTLKNISGDILNYVIMTSVFILSVYLKKYFRFYKQKNDELENEKKKLKYQIDETLTATHELEKYQYFLEKILNAITDPIFVKDKDHRLILVNDAECRLSGKNRDELLGKTDYDFFPKEQVDVFWEKDNKVFETGIEDINEEYITDSNGNLLYISTKKALIEIENVKYLVGIIRDITERKNFEDKIKKINSELEERVKERTIELESEKERLSVTLKSIGDGVIVTDDKGIIIMMNDIAVDITGWSQDESLGNKLSDIISIFDEKTRLKIEDPVDSVLKTGKIINIENNALIISKDGTEKIITDSAAPIKDKQNNIIGVILVFRDVTEKYKLENKLINTQRLESIGILASGIAHDFNNLLTGIFGFIELALNNIHTVEIVKECLNEAINVMKRAKDLTLQLLTFSKGGAPVRKPVSIVKIIKNCVNFVLSGSKILYDLNIPDNLWVTEVDENQISQAIDNLLINAYQAMPNGGKIFINVENYELFDKNKYNLAEGKYIKITIKDQGVGISIDIQKKVFDPFFTTKSTGSGLGLTTTYNIIKNHKGFIDYESEINKGTTFYIYLPALEYSENQNENQFKASHHGEGSALVLDDEAFIRIIAGEYLKNMGYEVVLVSTGEEAVKKYKNAYEDNKKFKFVILDLTLHNGMNGIDTLQKLLKIDNDIIAIASSGYSDDPVMADPKKYGFKDVLPKPYTYNELNDILLRLLG
jgi:PAS domain S-box-containing protein